MVKKICTALLSIALIVFWGISAFAAEPLINVTKPEGDESTYKKTYLICGNTEKEDVTVELSVYDNQLGYFVPLETTEGETNWVIGSSRTFMKEVNLPYYGANKIQVTSYRKVDPENKQVLALNIILLKEDIKDRVVNGNLRLDEVFNNNVKNNVNNLFN